MEQDIINSLNVLRNGGIILYPTDTIWGIGCDATNTEAVQKIYRLKQRTETKSMLVLVEQPERIIKYVREVPDIAWQLIDVNDKPMTIIYPEAINLAPNLVSMEGSIGIRIVNDDFCRRLIARFNRPIVSTSANISGQKAPSIFEEISDKIKNGVDYIVQWRQEDTSKRQPSQIIKVDVTGEVEIIRN